MDENIKKAFDYVNDLTKQLITLSSTIIALTVTFSKEILGAVEGLYKFSLLASWFLFVVSIVFGILTLMALIGNLDPMPQKPTKDKDGNDIIPEKPAPILTINSDNILGTSKKQALSFGLALFFAFLYGLFAIIKPSPKKQDTNTYVIVDKTNSGIDTITKIDTLYVIKKE